MEQTKDYSNLSENKKAFLEHYPKFKSIMHTAKAIGINPSTAFRWLNENDKIAGDLRFIKLFTQLKKEVLTLSLEEAEAELEDRALGRKPCRMSDILLMFYLKALAPEKYREKAGETRLVGDITIKLAIPREQLVEGRKELKEPSKELEAEDLP